MPAEAGARPFQPGGFWLCWPQDTSCPAKARSLLFDNEAVSCAMPRSGTTWTPEQARAAGLAGVAARRAKRQAAALAVSKPVRPALVSQEPTHSTVDKSRLTLARKLDRLADRLGDRDIPLPETMRDWQTYTQIAERVHGWNRDQALHQHLHLHNTAEIDSAGPQQVVDCDVESAAPQISAQTSPTPALPAAG